MNWMGGERRRHALKGKTKHVLQRQKAHFAKVRAAAHTMPDASRLRQPPPMAPSHHPPINTADTHLPRDSHEHSHSMHHSSSTRHPSPLPKALHHPSPLPPVISASRLANMSREERLLVANRQRLLARTDWLGLAASRPAPYNFPCSRDKDRIGKRRKIDKPKHYRHHLYQRPMTPLFGGNPPADVAVMSGALPDEDIQIRIGTDAFGTHTQPSQHSRTLPNTSMRQPSTDFEALSEESLLLGVDQDGFETLHHRHSLMSLVDRHTADSSLRGARNLEPLADTAVFSNTAPETMSLGAEESNVPHELVLMPQHQLLPTHNFQDIVRKSPAYPSNNIQNSDTDIDEEDDATWRALMQVQKATSGNSMAALRSSSHHGSDTTASSRAPIANAEPAFKPPDKANKPSPAHHIPQDEELWRDFVIGSEDSDDMSSLIPNKRRRILALQAEVVLPARSISQRPAIDSLPSDRATVGGTVFADEVKPRSAIGHGKQIKETSIAGHTTTPCYDDIGDLSDTADSSDYRTYTTGNIHASSAIAMTGYHKQFLKPNKRQLQPQPDNRPYS